MPSAAWNPDSIAVTMSSPPDRASDTPVQTLELKGTTLPVTAVMIGQADTAHLQLALAGKLGEAPGFFDGELAVLARELDARREQA